MPNSFERRYVTTYEEYVAEMRTPIIYPRVYMSQKVHNTRHVSGATRGTVALKDMFNEHVLTENYDVNSGAYELKTKIKAVFFF